MSLNHVAVFLLFVFVALPVEAQERMLGGFIGGITSSEAQESDGFGYESSLGFTGGLFFAIPVRGAFGAQLEVSYQRKGYKNDQLLDDRGRRIDHVDFRHDYISLLASPQYRTPLGSSGMRFYAFLGPRLDVLISNGASYVEDDGDRVPFDEGERIFAPRSLNDLVLGGAVGIGLDLVRVGVMPLVIELRYDTDLTPAWSILPRDQRFLRSDWRFSTFGLRLGLSF